MKWTIGKKIAIGYGLALVLLIIIGLVSYDSITRLVDAGNLTAHTNLVRFRLSNLLSHLQDAETGQRGYLVTGEDRYLDPYQSGILQVKDDVGNLKNLTADNPVQQRNIVPLEPLIDQKLAELKDTIDLRKSKGFDAARQVVLTDRGKSIMDSVRKINTEMDAEENRLAQIRVTEAEAGARGAKQTIIGATGLAVLLVVLVTYGMARNIAVPLQEITLEANRISTGDLTFDSRVKPRTDEVGALKEAFVRMSRSLMDIAAAARQIANGDLTVKVAPQSEKDVLGNSMATMIENLKRLNQDVRDGVNVLASSASEILAASTQVAAGATETAASLSETTTTVEEVRQTAQLSSQKAKYVLENAQKTVQVSQTGRKAVEETVAGMNRIEGQMTSVAESVVRLSEQSQAIGEIIATVNDIAEQSNLLAVNAAIEAAKAGEQGKGFSVVAQEVRSLAEQSKQATSQVRSILNDIQKAVSQAVMATEQGSKAVETGARQSREAGESIRSLAESITEASQASAQIAASAQQQLAGMDQVAQAMENIKQASTQNAASTKQAETAAQKLHEVGQKLQQLVEQYKV